MFEEKQQDKHRGAVNLELTTNGAEITKPEPVWRYSPAILSPITFSQTYGISHDQPASPSLTLAKSERQ